MAFENPNLRRDTASLSRQGTMGIAVGLIVLTLAAYYPALTGAMQWDDAGHVTRACPKGDCGPLEDLVLPWDDPAVLPRIAQRVLA